MVTSYANPGGTGDRTGMITGSATLTLQGGALSNMVDGSFSGVAYFGNGQSSGNIKFDFGSAKVIDEFKWYQDRHDYANGTWQLAGSNDNTNWADIGSPFAISTSTDITVASFVNTNAYRYYRMTLVSGSTSYWPYVQEIEFKIG